MNKNEYLQQQYAYAEAVSNRLSGDLILYAIQNRAFDVQFMQGYSFQQGIDFLEDAKRKFFSASVKQTIEQVPSDYAQIDNLIESIELHLQAVLGMQTSLEMWFKNMN